MNRLLMLIIAISTVSCSSVYVPSFENYADEVENLLHKHEDYVLVHYGKPDEIIELAEGTKALVYNQLPYKNSPLTDTTRAYCRTVFSINQSLQVQYIRADGNFCVR